MTNTQQKPPSVRAILRRQELTTYRLGAPRPVTLPTPRKAH